MDPRLSLTYPSYDLGSRPGSEVVGARSPMSWQYDVYSRAEKVFLPEGPGRDAGGSFEGFHRNFDSLDRMVDVAAIGNLSATTPGATWTWGGGRLYGMDTKGTLGTALRLGYLGGEGPQLPGGSNADSKWKLGKLTWGAGSGNPTGLPGKTWGQFGFGYRGTEGDPRDGAKLGREAMKNQGLNLFAGQGWSWDYDAAARLTAAWPGRGDQLGRRPVEAQGFHYQYGKGDELERLVDEATGSVVDTRLSFSIPLDPATLGEGLKLEELSSSGWQTVAPTELMTGFDDGEGLELWVSLRSAWKRETKYRAHVGQGLKGRTGRPLATARQVELSFAASAVISTSPIDRRYPPDYESYRAAANTLGGRFPGGQTSLFQGLWTDPVTGLSYARARWYEVAKGIVTAPVRAFQADAKAKAERLAAYGPGRGGYQEYQQIKSEQAAHLANNTKEALLDAIPGRGSGKALGSALEECLHNGLNTESCGKKMAPAGLQLAGDATLVAGGSAKALKVEAAMKFETTLARLPVAESGATQSLPSQPRKWEDFLPAAREAVEAKKAELGHIEAYAMAQPSSRHGFSYSPRVRNRGVEDPGSHNFPYSFDDVILATAPIPQKGGYNSLPAARFHGRKSCD